MSSNAELNELKRKYVAAGAASPATAFADRAENAEIWDADGNRFIDFAGGIGVLNVGHRHPKVVAAVKAQLDKLMHTCQTVMPYEGYVKVAEKLSQIVPVRGHAKVMLANSGAEALENAVKIARAATGRSNVICFDGGWDLPSGSIRRLFAREIRSFLPFAASLRKVDSNDFEDVVISRSLISLRN